MQYKMSRWLVCVAIVVALVGNLEATSFAQQSRSVVIKDGKVTVNGAELPDESVPESLRQFEGNVNFTFTGDEEPLIGFGTRTYRIEQDRIVEIESFPMPFSFPGDAAGKARALTLRFGADSLHLHSSLEDFAREMEGLRMKIPRVELDTEQLERDMTELRSSLSSLRDLAVPDAMVHFRRQMPRAHVFRPLDIEVYMDDIREIDQSLYEQLLNEREQEDESIDLARRFHEAESSEEREALSEELRAHLDEVFEIRQENRREEIRRLEAKIDNLRRRLESREAMRERIIQNRLDVLLEE